jgi:hypothetical protein
MVKRQEVEVDEDLIKSMMTGDIPRLNNPPVEEKKVVEKQVDVSKPQKKNEKIDERETVDDTEEDYVEMRNSEDSQGSNKETSQSKSKRKREPKDYQSLFLKKNGTTKRQTYVSAELYDKIAKILGIIAKDISVPNFIDNVLENHLKEYKDEINDIYRIKSDLQI